MHVWQWPRMVVYGLSILTGSLGSASGQSFEARHKSDWSTNPRDLQFRLSVEGGPRSFHIGERIPLILEFRSDSPAKYKLDGATYDRSGRLPTEEFVMERTDAADPYEDYLRTGVLGGWAGGLRTTPVLDAEPYQIHLDLNDWYRFDRAGVYRLYLKSHRLSRERAPGETGGRLVHFAAVSNVIEVTLLEEDPGWAAVKLLEIESILREPEPERPKPGGPPVLVQPIEAKLAMARRELRYVANARAVELAFQDARKLNGSPDILVLIAARDRKGTVAALDRYLADPQSIIREWDIRVRALFTWLLKERPAMLPTPPWRMAEGTEWKQVQAEAEARFKRYEQILRAEAIRLIPIAAQKDKEVRKASADAIAAIVPEAARAALLTPPDDYGLSRAELIARFLDFPSEQQTELLGKKWDLVRGREMIPNLQVLVSRAPARSLAADATALGIWFADDGIADTALRRLHQLSPAEASRTIGADLGNGQVRFGGFAVRELAPQDMPEADETFKRWLQSNQYGGLRLIAKFGTERLAVSMQEQYGKRRWSCIEEAAFQTYFMRIFPGAGPTPAREFFRRAMADRERGCHQSLIGEVGNVVWNPALEALAAEFLEDPDVATATSAAGMLAAKGGPAVEPLLWKRLEQWSERWRGRTREFEVHPISGGEPHPEGRLGETLSRSLASARSWLLDERRRQRLRRLCIDRECEERWGREPGENDLAISVSNGGRFYPTAFRLGWYQTSSFDTLKEKLRQYPSGTTFRWCPQTFDPPDGFSAGQREEMFQELKAMLTGHRMRIEPCAGQAQP